MKRFVSDELPVLYSREKEKDNIQKHHTQSARKEKLSITVIIERNIKEKGGGWINCIFFLQLVISVFLFYFLISFIDFVGCTESYFYSCIHKEKIESKKNRINPRSLNQFHQMTFTCLATLNFEMTYSFLYKEDCHVTERTKPYLVYDV